MKIWLDTTLLFRRFTSNHQDDYGPDPNCPKDPGTDPHDNNPERVRTHGEQAFPSSLIKNLHGSFVQSQTLHIQACGEALWLVCNPIRSGMLAVLDAEAYALLECFRSPNTVQEVINYGQASHSSIKRAVALFAHLGFLQDLEQPASVPNTGPQQTLAIWFHITNACNLRCHYCYVQKTSEHMADDIAKRAVDAIMRSALKHHYRRVKLNFAGGEATLRLPQVFATYDYALQKTLQHGLGLSASILSNGAILPQRSIDQLKQRQIGIMISLDGVGEDHDQQRPLVNGKGSFKLIDQTITRLLVNHLIPFINITVTNRNLNQLPKLIEYILQRGLPFGISYYRENEYSARLADLQYTETQMIDGMLTVFSYLEQHLPQRRLLGSLVDNANTNVPHQFTCGMGRSYFAIDQRGGIAKCQMDLAQTVTTIDTDDPLQAIREDRRGVQTVAVDEKEGCRTCEWRYWCCGGCPMLTYRLTGRSDIKSPNCAIYKALFPKALRLEALRLLQYEPPITL